MSAVNSPDTLVGLFKEIYSKLGLVQAFPSNAIAQERFPFEVGEATGDKYVVALALQKEGGFSYAPTSGPNAVPTLNAPIAGAIVRAEIEGYGIYLVSQLAYAAAAKAAAQGKQAFLQAHAAVMKNMKYSHAYRLECSLLYGRDGLGIVETNTTGVLLITEASFASGIWGAGLKDSILESFTGVGPSVTQHDGDLTIASVNISSRTVTVTGTSTSVVTNDVLYFKGARTASAYNECPGLYRILTNAGTLFNVSAVDYDAWKAQSFAVDGQLSMTAIMKGSALGVAYGLEDALLFVAPERFAQLASDEASLRRYPDATKKGARGPESIMFQMGQVMIEIMCHPLLKRGHAMLLPSKEVHRIGSVDITDSLAGADGSLTVQVSNKAAVEFRTMSDQGIYIEVPARAVLLTGITS